MGKYICQLRRGWKETDSNGNITRDDWSDYEATDGHLKPQAGELVVEFDNGVPRLKIGDGEREFSDLPYMSVDSFVLPTQASITLDANKWLQASDNRYYQEVTVNNAVITVNSKIDLQPDAAMLEVFHQKDLAFVAENNNGTVSVFCVGQVPTNDYTIQATVKEVVTG